MNVVEIKMILCRERYPMLKERFEQRDRECRNNSWTERKIFDTIEKIMKGVPCSEIAGGDK